MSRSGDFYMTMTIDRPITSNKCDHIWENPRCSKLYEILVSRVFDKLYLRAMTDRMFHLGARAFCLQSRHTHNK